MSVRRIALVIALAALLPGCAARPLTPLERYHIESGGPGEAMPVVQDEDPAGDAFLRAVAEAVDPLDPVVRRLAKRMRVTVEEAPGVGIAAPQVGISRRMVWVQRLDKADKPFEIYLNPRIVRRSQETEVGWEGCLSVSAGYGQVQRSIWLDLQWQGLDGRRHREHIEGFVAVIVQHELDHLDGVLFVDRKEPGELVPKEEYRAMRERERAAAEEPEE